MALLLVAGDWELHSDSDDVDTGYILKPGGVRTPVRNVGIFFGRVGWENPPGPDAETPEPADSEPETPAPEPAPQTSTPLKGKGGRVYMRGDLSTEEGIRDTARQMLDALNGKDNK